MSYYLFIDRVVFGLGSSTRLVKRVVCMLSLNVSGRNQVRHKPDMRTRLIGPNFEGQKITLQLRIESLERTLQARGKKCNFP